MTDNYPERPVSPFAGTFFNPFSDYGAQTQTGDGDGSGGNRPCKKNRDCPQGKKCIEGTCQDPDAVPDDGGDDEEDGGDGTRCRPRCGPNKKCRGGVCVPRQGAGQGNGNNNGNNNRRRRRRNRRQDDAVAAFGGATTQSAPSFSDFTGLGFTPGGDPGAMSADLSGQGWGSGSMSSGMAEYTPPPNPFFTPAQGKQAQTNPYVTPIGQDNPFMPRRRR